MNKNLLIGLGILVVVLVAGYAYMQMQPKSDTGTEQTQGQNTNNGSTAGAKINIQAVCTGALAYMTFPSSAEADAFVQDCIDGKHPEVIEQYRAQIGADNNAAL